MKRTPALHSDSFIELINSLFCYTNMLRFASILKRNGYFNTKIIVLLGKHITQTQKEEQNHTVSYITTTINHNQQEQPQKQIDKRTTEKATTSNEQVLMNNQRVYDQKFRWILILNNDCLWP